MVNPAIRWADVAAALRLARPAEPPSGAFRRWAARNAHTHAFPELALCVEGRLFYGVGGRAVRLRPGTVWALPRGVPHDRTYGPHHGAGLDLWLHFLPGGATLNLTRHDPRRGITRLPLAWPDAVSAELAAEAAARLDPLDAEHPTPDPAGGFFLLYFVARLCAALADGAARRPVAERNESFSRIRAYIEANLGDDLRLQDLAKLAGYSPFHFHRQFARAAGLTPRRFVEQRRLTRARALLEQGYRVTAAAMETGFSSPAEFSRVFRRAFGVSPSQWTARR